MGKGKEFRVKGKLGKEEGVKGEEERSPREGGG